MHRAARATRGPDSERPVPIFLEHTHQIIGWGRISRKDGALKVEDAKIDHEETRRRLAAGELSGFSIGGMAAKATCSICAGSYLDCPHVAGEDYAGQSCQVNVGEISLREISLVRNPINQQAVVHIRS
jgi:hypothetical protein